LLIILIPILLIAYICLFVVFYARLLGISEFILPNSSKIFGFGGFEVNLLYHEIFLQKTYNKNGILLKDGDVIFDVGANIGMFTMHQASLHNSLKIYAFEPVNQTFKALEQNVRKIKKKILQIFLFIVLRWERKKQVHTLYFLLQTQFNRDWSRENFLDFQTIVSQEQCLQILRNQDPFQ